jgi:hypothetical protein
MIEMHTGIVAPSVVSDPFAVGVDVRSFGMSGLVAVVRGGRSWMRSSRWRGTVGGDILDASADFVTLGKGYEGKQATKC